MILICLKRKMIVKKNKKKSIQIQNYQTVVNFIQKTRKNHTEKIFKTNNL